MTATVDHPLITTGLALTQGRRGLQRPQAASGFSLVEVMVAMVIGMLGLIVMMQVFALFEGQKRTTTGGGDAQNSGAITLYALQRDLQQSGYGTSAFASLGCQLTVSPPAPAAAFTTGLIPVSINDVSITGADANTDTLLIMYSNSNSPIEGNGITSQAAQNSYGVKTGSSFGVGDYVYALPQNRPTPCNLTLEQATDVTPHAPTPATTVLVPVGIPNMTNGTLYNLGSSIKVIGYAVRNGNLTMCDYTAKACSVAANNNDTSVWVPIANGIVSMKAEYGLDTSGPPMDGLIDTYSNTIPASLGINLACKYIRVEAIRVALVARNSQFNKEIVTFSATNAAMSPGTVANAPTWLGSATNPIVLGPDASADEPWKHYRYKVFQSLVPFRNVLWTTAQGVAAGC